MSIMDLLDKSELDIEQKIVQELLNNENLDTKTELSKPMLWAGISVLKDFYEKHDLPISKSILEHFSYISFKYLISLNRKGRLEYLDALKGLKDSLEEKKSPISMGMNPIH